MQVQMIRKNKGQKQSGRIIIARFAFVNIGFADKA
jgi:hypothetical protein